MADLSTEDFEALWKDIRQFEIAHSTGSSDPAKGWNRYGYFKSAREQQSQRESSDDGVDRLTLRRFETLLTSTYRIPPRFVDDEFFALLYLIRDYHMGTWYNEVQSSDGVLSYDFIFNSDCSRPVLVWYSGDAVDLEGLIDEASVGNPADKIWNPCAPRTLVDDVHSPSICFDDHSLEDIHLARRARLESLARDPESNETDRRVHNLSSSSLPRDQVVHRMNVDNSIIQARLNANLETSTVEWHPDGSDDECVSYEFLRSSDEHDTPAATPAPAHSGVPKIPKPCGKRKSRPETDDPSTWKMPRLKKACTDRGIPLKEKGKAKRKQVLLNELHYANNHLE